MVRKTMKRRASDDDDSGSEAGAPVAKKSKSGPAAAATGGSLRDDDGNMYWPVLRVYTRRRGSEYCKGPSISNVTLLPAVEESASNGVRIPRFDSYQPSGVL